MSVEQHRQRADAHAAKARRHRGRYDPKTRIERNSGDLTETGRWKRDYDDRDEEEYSWGGSSYNPSARHLRDARRHEALAQEHLDSARFLERFEEAKCGAFPPEIGTQCPLLGQLVDGKGIPGGVRVRLAEDVDVDAAVEDMRCHVAFARSIGHSG
ncbi:MAG TPA: hypothetical protein ENI85_18960 [Deltaproteobacteria bacterium]|nr:hypothetical protein [Deltaproteobacteria bacterium]